VHVWHARLGAPGSGGGDDGGRADAALLSADERARVEAFAFAEPRRRWVWARATLRRVLARYLGAGEPAAIAFAYGEHGKPSLAGGGLSFNLSHTGERLVVAIAREGALGVDVERVSRCTSPLVLADRYFAAAAPARLRAVPAPGRAGAFAALWTAKEAYAKALGRGLPLPLRDFEVIGELAAPAIGRTAAEDPRAPGDWVLAQAAVAPDCLCTVAWAAGPGAVALVEWGRLVEGPGDGSGAGAEVGAPAAK
jgi:4'-phosphopantetheinyl transferase